MNSKILKIIYFSILGLKTLECLTPFSHGDAFSYHLIIPKLSLEHGLKFTIDNFFASFQAGYFEFVYFLTIGLFGPTLLGQISSQLVHFAFGLGLSSFIITKIVERPSLKWTAGITFLTLSKSSDFFLYAKNDGFIVTLALLTYYFIERKNRYDFWLKGTLFGLIPSIKLSGVFIAIPLYIYNILKTKKLPIKASFLALVIVLPGLYFKYYLTKNPFFPGFIDLSKDYLPSSVLTIFKAMMQQKVSFESGLLNVKLFLMGKIIIPIGLIFLIIRKQKIHFPTISIAIGSFLFYLLINGGIASPRFYFSSYAFFILSLFLSIPEKLSLDRKILTFLLILILADSKIDKTIGRVVSNISMYATKDEASIVRENIPNSQVWDYFPKNLKNLTYVFSDDLPTQYYAPQNIIMQHYPTQPQVDFFDQCKDPTGLKKYRYFILSNRYQNPCYQIIAEKSTLIGQSGVYKIFEKK